MTGVQWENIELAIFSNDKDEAYGPENRKNRSPKVAERKKAMSIIRDISRKDEGHQRIAWVARHMPVLNGIGERFDREKPLAGKRISLSVHLEAKTAYLAKVLRRGGAELSVTGSNPRSTQDSVCAALVDEGITVHAIHGATHAEYAEFWAKALSVHPHIVIDDGADLMSLLLGDCREYADCLIGGCEETTSGVRRLRGWEKQRRLTIPAIAVNDARCKALFDNTYGTGQTVWDGIMRTTNMQINGKTVVVAGYGLCGKGIANVAKGLGAQVIVTEVDPICALLAVMDGHRAMSMDEAAPMGDIFITATACRDVIGREHFSVMKDNAIVSNAGHFNIEIDLAGLKSMAKARVSLRKNIDGYLLETGRTICVIADGGLVNIAAADGHPAEIMDMSFSLQALSAECIAKNGRDMAPGVHQIPVEIDRMVGELKLKAMGGSFDVLNDEQKAYIESH
jgi:adenosylhomocysteinase